MPNTEVFLLSAKNDNLNALSENIEVELKKALT